MDIILCHRSVNGISVTLPPKKLTKPLKKIAMATRMKVGSDWKSSTSFIAMDKLIASVVLIIPAKLKT